MATKERRPQEGDKEKEMKKDQRKEKKDSSFVQECSFSFYKPRSSEYCLLSRDHVCVYVCVCDRVIY